MLKSPCDHDTLEMISRNGRLLGLVALIWLLCSLQGCILELYDSIKSDLDITLEAQQRDQLKTRTEILAINYVPWPSLSVQGDASRYSPISLEDPLQTVKERFLATVAGVLGLTNVRPMEDPRFSPSKMRYGVAVSELVGVFGHGYVIDFQTTSWSLTVWGDETIWQFNMTNAAAPALLAYRARARLIDLDRGKTLWQTKCYVHTERHKGEEWVANDHELLKAKRDQVAALCAEQLADKFFGKEEPDSKPPTY